MVKANQACVPNCKNYGFLFLCPGHSAQQYPRPPQVARLWTIQQSRFYRDFRKEFPTAPQNTESHFQRAKMLRENKVMH